MRRSPDAINPPSLFNAAVIRDQLHVLVRTTYRLFVPALVLLASLLLVALRYDLSTAELTKDVASLANVPFYYGLVANIGVLFWCATAALCFFAAQIVRDRNMAQPYVRFLVFSGAFTLFLLFDDLLRLQDHVLPTYLKLPGGLISILYLLTLLVYGRLFARLIRSTDFVLLACAFAFFGGSLLTELVPFYFKGHLLLEDALKLLGILSWFAYYLRVCRKLCA